MKTRIINDRNEMLFNWQCKFIPNVGDIVFLEEGEFKTVKRFFKPQTNEIDIFVISIDHTQEKPRKSTINLTAELSERSSHAIITYLRHEYQTEYKVNWEIDQVKNIDISKLSKFRNFGVRSKMEVQEFIERLNQKKNH